MINQLMKYICLRAVFIRETRFHLVRDHVFLAHLPSVPPSTLPCTWLPLYKYLLNELRAPDANALGSTSIGSKVNLI